MTKRDRRRRRSARLSPNLAWADRPQLSPIQQAIWGRASRIHGATTVALAGSAALAVHGHAPRTVRDIDLFTDNGPEVYHVYSNLLKALRADDEYTVEEDDNDRWRTRRSMYVTSSAGWRTKVDIGTQIRLYEAAVLDNGLRVLQIDDIAGGKMGALTDRTLPKDVADVAALLGPYTLTELCQIAAAREPRFNPHRLAARLTEFLDQDNLDAFGDLSSYYRSKVEAWMRELVMFVAGGGE